MDSLSEKVIVPLLVGIVAGLASTIIGGLVLAGLVDLDIPITWLVVAGLVVAVLVIAVVRLAFTKRKRSGNRISPQTKTRRDRVTQYSDLSDYDRDILKALHDSGTTLLSLRYDDGRPPSIQARLDHVLDTPVACRLIVSHHYNKSLGRLSSNDFIKVDGRWIHERPNPRPINTLSYELTEIGYEFIHKYAVGSNLRERFIRNHIRGLNKHNYIGRYRDDVGKDKLGELPTFLRGNANLKKYFGKPGAAWPIGSSRDNVKPDIYECVQGVHEDRVEWMVAVPFMRAGDHHFDVAQGDYVILWIRTDEWIQKEEMKNMYAAATRRRKRLRKYRANTSVSDAEKPIILTKTSRAYRPPNKPRYLEFSQELVGRWDAYTVQAKVISIAEGDDPVVTVLKLGESKAFDPSPIIFNS